MSETKRRFLLTAATVALALLTIGGASATAIASRAKEAACQADCKVACPKTTPCDQPCQPCPDCKLPGCPKQAN